MCVIMYGTVRDVRNLDLKSAWECNPDGAGFIYYGRNVVWRKGIMRLDVVEKILSQFSQDAHLAVHFRLATHGSVAPANCHPWRVGKDSLLLHNGILSALGKAGAAGESDSAHLARILGRHSATDREALLESLPGRFLLSTGRDVVLFGNWITDHGVKLSCAIHKPMPVSWQLPWRKRTDTCQTATSRLAWSSWEDSDEDLESSIFTRKI